MQPVGLVGVGVLRHWSHIRCQDWRCLVAAIAYSVFASAAAPAAVLDCPLQSVLRMTDGFGAAAALSEDGTRAVVGAHTQAQGIDAAPPGSLFVYQKESSGRWSFLRRIRIPTLPGYGTRIHRIEFSGSYLLVAHSGGLAVFHPNLGGPDAWGHAGTAGVPGEIETLRVSGSTAVATGPAPSLQRVLRICRFDVTTVSLDVASEIYNVQKVSAWGDYVLAWREVGPAGVFEPAPVALELYHRNQGGAEQWGLVQTLRTPDYRPTVTGDVAIADGLIAEASNGEVHTWRPDGAGGWTLSDVLSPPAGTPAQLYGQSISAASNGLTLAVSRAPQFDGLRTIEVWRRRSGGRWQKAGETPLSPGGSQFLSGSVLLAAEGWTDPVGGLPTVGVWSANAVPFPGTIERTGELRVPETGLVPPGGSFAVSRSWLAVGVPGDDSGAPSSGAVYLFRGSTPWDLFAVIKSPTPSTLGRFGASVDLYQETDDVSGRDVLVVGAPGEQSGRGVVYQYNVGSLATTPPRVWNGTIDTGQLGAAVAVRDGLVLAGRPGDDSVQLFTRSFQGVWSSPGQLNGGVPAGSQFGARLSVSKDGNRCFTIARPPATPAVFRFDRKFGEWSLGTTYLIPAGEPRGTVFTSVACDPNEDRVVAGLSSGRVAVWEGPISAALAPPPFTHFNPEVVATRYGWVAVAGGVGPLEMVHFYAQVPGAPAGSWQLVDSLVGPTEPAAAAGFGRGGLQFHGARVFAGAPVSGAGFFEFALDAYSRWAGPRFSSRDEMDPLGDPDGDGASNVQEFGGGTDPVSAASSPRPTIAPRFPSTNAPFYQAAHPKASYPLDNLWVYPATSTDLSPNSWRSAASPFEPTANWTVNIDAGKPAPSPSFHRFEFRLIRYWFVDEP